MAAHFIFKANSFKNTNVHLSKRTETADVGMSPMWHSKMHYNLERIFINDILILAATRSNVNTERRISVLLTPTAGMISKSAALWNGGVQARNFQIRVRRRRPVPLHRDQPGGRDFVSVGADGHAQGGAEIVRQIAGFLFFESEIQKHVTSLQKFSVSATGILLYCDASFS